ncbi:MAG: FlgD immunoglobulin-like domain containing protein, partial [bacterium]|nr:FlgD immunoglobulin-like domain containing protein [bacterium]
QQISTITKQKQSAGYYSVVWNGKDERGNNVSSGVYFYQLQAKGVSGKSNDYFVETRKMMLVR